jgi:hypothetical protein
MRWIASLVLIALIGLCLASGIVEVFVGYGRLPGPSPIQLHVGSALAGLPLLVWHVLRHRRQRIGRVDLSRRKLLRTGTFAVGIGAAYAALEGAGHLLRLPSATRVATGSHQLTATEFPATIWLFDQTPLLPADSGIQVDGRAVTPAELAARGRVVHARLDCTSGWYADADWTGVPLAELIAADRLAKASSLVVTSFTGYHRRFPASEAGALHLATACQGEPLGVLHGAPVRLVAPGYRGFWWVKWVASVTLSDRPAWAQSPFPLQ